MNSRQRETLQAIFSTPTPRTLEWKRIESLLLALGARTTEGAGSRVRPVSPGALDVHAVHCALSGMRIDGEMEPFLAAIPCLTLISDKHHSFPHRHQWQCFPE